MVGLHATLDGMFTEEDVFEELSALELSERLSQGVTDLRFLRYKLEGERQSCQSHVDPLKERLESNLGTFTEPLGSEMYVLAGESVKIDYTFLLQGLEHPFFYYLDSFILDLKRCAEFALRLAYEALGSPTGNFSVQNLAKHLDPDGDGGDTPPRFVRKVRDQYPDHAGDLAGYSAWLGWISGHRGELAHRKATDQLAVTVKRTAFEDFEESGEIDPREIPIDDARVLVQGHDESGQPGDFAQKQLDYLDGLVEVTLLLALEATED